MKNYLNKCIKYWDMVQMFTIEQAAALWCGVDPDQPYGECYGVKCQVLLGSVMQGAIPSYRDNGIKANFNEINRERLRIKRDDLKAWFEQLSIADRPAFLFDESRSAYIPDVSETAELNTMKALAIMAWMLAKSSTKYKIKDRPNAKEIGSVVSDKAKEMFGQDQNLFLSFNRKISTALKILNEETGKFDDIEN